MFRTIGIKDLKPGMYVQKIVLQKGSLKIKSQGKVTTQTMVDKLKKQGVKKLEIDPSKAFSSEQSSIEDPANHHQPVKKAVKRTSFDTELIDAKTLYEKGKRLQEKLMESVLRELPMDLAIPTEFAKKLISSLERNHNALMCLTRIREKDTYLLEHSLNVAIILANFARHLQFDDTVVTELALAGFVHDIGKIKIPDEILHKPSRLNKQEMTVMRNHVLYGIQTLEEMDLPEHIIRTMSEHHERLDGKGYPKGLKSAEISQYGQMIAVCDVYDAIVADRCYKAGESSKRAMQILLKDSPEKYDRELVQKFIQCVGIYPTGSLVKLDNEQIALVVGQAENQPLKPMVKVFYSIRGSHYVSPKTIEMAKSHINIDSAVMASDYNLDFNRFFEEKIAV